MIFIESPNFNTRLSIIPFSNCGRSAFSDVTCTEVLFDGFGTTLPVSPCFSEVVGRSLLEVTEDAGLPLSLPWDEPSGLLILFDL